MKKEYFDNLEKISTNFIEAIDSAVPLLQQHEAKDHIWGEEVVKKRREARKTHATAFIRERAADAARKAQVEIDAMRADFRTYMAKAADPAQLATLRALLDNGVELTDAEIQAFASSKNYTVLRILQPHSRGRVIVPSADGFERDMKELTNYFQSLGAYSGPGCELSDFVTSRPYGLGAKTMGAIICGQAAGFHAKLAEIAKRWEVVKE